MFLLCFLHMTYPKKSRLKHILHRNSFKNGWALNQEGLGDAHGGPFISGPPPHSQNISSLTWGDVCFFTSSFVVVVVVVVVVVLNPAMLKNWFVNMCVFFPEQQTNQKNRGGWHSWSFGRLKWIPKWKEAAPGPAQRSLFTILFSLGCHPLPSDQPIPNLDGSPSAFFSWWLFHLKKHQVLKQQGPAVVNLLKT